MGSFTASCWRSLQGELRSKQLLFIVRSLHKSAASEALGISAAAGDETVPDRMVAPDTVGEKAAVKSLKEMPGPSTLSNLVEFFWKDGFSRIHEIQVI